MSYFHGFLVVWAILAWLHTIELGSYSARTETVIKCRFFLLIGWVATAYLLGYYVL